MIKQIRKIAELAVFCCSLLAMPAWAANAAPEDQVEWLFGESDLINWKAPPSSVYQSDTQQDRIRHIAISISAKTIAVRTRRVVHYPSVASVQDEDFQKMSFNPETSRLRVYEAAIVRANGKVQRFEPEKAVVDQQTEDYVFTNYADVITPLPGLTKDATKILDYEILIDRAALHTPWSRTFLPQTGTPRGEFRFTVKWEQPSMRPNWNNSFENLSCEETELTLNCTARDIKPARTDVDVFYYDELPQIQIAEQQSWGDLAEAARESVDLAMQQTQLLNRTFVAVTAEHDDPQLAIFDYVSRNIRYVSYSQGEHAIVPHDVDTTIENQYGDCKDKSTLLAAMLTKAGINAHPVLVATDRSDPTKLTIPASSHFDHMAVCNLDETGAPIECLDPTVHTAKGVGTTYVLQGKVGLPLIKGAKPIKLPQDKYRWQTDVIATIAFDHKGNQIEVQKRRYSGPYATIKRAQLEGLDPDDLQRELRQEYHDTHSTSADPVFDIKGLYNPQRAVEISSSASFDSVIELDEEASYSENLSWAIDLLNQLRVQNEVYDYDFPGLRVSSLYRFGLPREWSARRKGTPFNLRTDYGAFTREITEQKNALSGEKYDVINQRTLLELPAQRIPVDEFDRFTRFLKAIRKMSPMYFTADSSP